MLDDEVTRVVLVLRNNCVRPQHCVAVCVGRLTSPQTAPPPIAFTLVTVPGLLSKLQGLQRSSYPSLLSEWQLYTQKQLHPQTKKIQ